LDCFKDEISKLTKLLNLRDYEDDILTIKKAISELETNYDNINERIKGIEKNNDAKAIKNVFNKFKSGQIERDDLELIELIEFMEKRYTKGNKLSAILSYISMDRLNTILTFLRENSIFIWSSGELEDYYTMEVKQMMGSKDLKALELSYLLLKEDNALEDYFTNIDELTLLCNKILEKV